MAHTDAAQVERLAADDVDEWNIAAIEPAALAPLFDDGTRAVVALLGDDDDNLAALRFVRRRPRLSILCRRPQTNLDCSKTGLPRSSALGLITF